MRCSSSSSSSSFWLILLALLVLFDAAALALSSHGTRILVVLDELKGQDKYSHFLGDLEDRGFSLSFVTPKDPTLSLTKHNIPVTDHLLLLTTTSKGLGPALSTETLLNFLSLSGNILIVLSPTGPTPSALTSLLQQVNIILPSEVQSTLVDHFTYDANSASENHDVVLANRPRQLREGVTQFFSGDGLVAVPRAIPQTLGQNSSLLFPILRAPDTSYTHSPIGDGYGMDEPLAYGSQLSLVSAMQTRNSARLVVLGSAEMIQDGWLEAEIQRPGQKIEQAKNRDFARQISEWLFKEVGVLKVGAVNHWMSEIGENIAGTLAAAGTGDVELNPTSYRIKNDVAFTIELSEYQHTHLVPFTPPAGDAIQMEFRMLSPFHRISLAPLSTTQNSTVFGTVFKLPDQHGIFNFRVNYKRPFLTYVDEKREVAVRHIAHDEWPRSWEISGAWVGVAGIGTTIVGWITFLALWMWGDGGKDATLSAKKSV